MSSGNYFKHSLAWRAAARPEQIDEASLAQYTWRLQTFLNSANQELAKEGRSFRQVWNEPSNNSISSFLSRMGYHKSRNKQAANNANAYELIARVNNRSAAQLADENAQDQLNQNLAQAAYNYSQEECQRRALLWLSHPAAWKTETPITDHTLDWIPAKYLPKRDRENIARRKALLGNHATAAFVNYLNQELTFSALDEMTRSVIEPNETFRKAAAKYWGHIHARNMSYASMGLVSLVVLAAFIAVGVLTNFWFAGAVLIASMVVLVPAIVGCVAGARQHQKAINKNPNMLASWEPVKALYDLAKKITGNKQRFFKQYPSDRADRGNDPVLKSILKLNAGKNKTVLDREYGAGEDQDAVVLCARGRNDASLPVAARV
jgi:hypothetical protein